MIAQYPSQVLVFAESQFRADGKQTRTGVEMVTTPLIPWSNADRPATKKSFDRINKINRI